MILAWFSGRSAVDLLVLGAAGLGAVTLIGKAILAVVRFFQRLEKVVVAVEKQLYPNGGTSLRDAVNRIQERLDIIDLPSKEVR